jgi:hypothetical protein
MTERRKQLRHRIGWKRRLREVAMLGLACYMPATLIDEEETTSNPGLDPTFYRFKKELENILDVLRKSTPK